MKIKIVAFIDHEIGYRLLEKMFMHHRRDTIEIVAAVTTIDNGKKWWPGVESLCLKAAIPLLIYEEQKEAVIASVSGADWLLLLSWKYIIPRDLLQRPKHGAVNLHYSLLPEYRGLYPVNWAIIEGKKVTGITYHIVTEEIDAGEILIQEKEPIFLSDTARTLQRRLDGLAFQCFDNLLAVLRDSTSGEHSGRPQTGISSYKARDDFNRICEIDLDRNFKGLDFYNLIRGLSFKDAKNAFIVDRETRKKIFFNVSTEV